MSQPELSCFFTSPPMEWWDRTVVMGHNEISSISANWKTLVISPSKALFQEMAPLLNQHLSRSSVFEMHAYPDRKTVLELGGPQGPNLCFLDLGSDQDRALALIAELLTIQPAMKIVVLLGVKNPDIILKAMRQGAVEFLVRPFDSAQLETALGRIAALEATEGTAKPQGRVICVIPAKGACGASTIACTLALNCKKSGFKKVLLADLDPTTGTQSFLLKIKSAYSFLDALHRSNTLDADLWRGMINSAPGFDVLTAPELTPQAAESASDASLILDFARANYDVVIVDLENAYGSFSLSVSRRADDVIVVATNELPALQAAQKVLGYLEANRVERNKMRLVVNRYSKEAGLSRDVIEAALHSEIYHTLPADYESIHRCLIEGRPIGAGTNFGKSVAQLGERLCGRPPGSEVPAKKNSALSGIFSLFSRNG